MLTNSECYKLAGKKINEIFGTEYLNKNKEYIKIARSDQGNEIWFYVMIKSKDDTPKLKANDIGWTVYADIHVNKHNGNILVVDYQLEN